MSEDRHRLDPQTKAPLRWGFCYFKELRGELRGEERGQLNLKQKHSGLMLEPQPEQQANDGAYDDAQQEFFRS